MDTGFAAYGEEMSVAAIAKRLGLPVVFSPQLKVVHGEHSTVGRRLTRQKYSLQKQAFEHCYDSYGDLLIEGVRRRA
jgi:GT2 family glycosyltransferase